MQVQVLDWDLIGWVGVLHYIHMFMLCMAHGCIAHGCRLMGRMPGGQSCTWLQADEPFACRA